MCYAVGLPVAFLCILTKHRRSISKDQSMRVAGQGDTEATNPYFHIRTRYQELYRCSAVATVRACVHTKRHRHHCLGDSCETSGKLWLASDVFCVRCTVSARGSRSDS